MTEYMHHQNGHRQAQKVGDEWGIEVSTWFTLQAIVETQQQCNENAGNDNVAQAKHSEVGGIESIDKDVLWEDQLDWCIEAFGNGNHDIRAEHPEYIIDEQARQQNQTGNDIVQMQQFNTVYSECNTEQIVGDPVFFQQIPDSDD